MSGSMFEASFDASALDKIIAKLKPKQMPRIMKVIAEQLVAAVEVEFDTSGHGKWPPLAPSTLRKARVVGNPLAVGSKRHSKAMAAFYTSRAEGGSLKDAGAAYRKAGGVKMKTRGQSFDAPEGSERHNEIRAAYYEARGEGDDHEAATAKAMKVAQRGGILQDTGALAGSIRGESGEDFALATTDKFYAVFHVSDAPRTIIPLRNFFDVPDDVYDEAANTILESLAALQ